MKKSEIKRRRRVMPATNDQHLAPFSVSNTQPLSVSPEPSSTTLAPFYEHNQQQHPDHSHPHQLPLPIPSEHSRHTRAPIAVDFTHFGKPASTDLRPETQPAPPQSSRKRSFSASTSSDQQQQPTSPAQYPASDQSRQSESENIDPSLSTTQVTTTQNFRAPQAQMGTDAQSEQLRQERRAKLEMEMTAMREALIAKEREMAELSN